MKLVLGSTTVKGSAFAAPPNSSGKTNAMSTKMACMMLNLIKRGRFWLRPRKEKPTKRSSPPKGMAVYRCNIGSSKKCFAMPKGGIRWYM